MAKILISGGSGLVGKSLTRLLLEKGHEVRWLSRNEGHWRNVKKFRWDPARGFADEKAFENIEHLVHLAGAGIFDKRWTKKYKLEILASRIRSAELLYTQVRKRGISLRSFTGASAVGYYGAVTGGGERNEEDKYGKDFLAQVCVAWEHSYAPFKQAGIRTNIIRTSIVLDGKEGALPRLVTPFRLGLGAALGNGDQAFPWIHIADLARIYEHAMFSEKTSGTFNASAPSHVSNLQFSSTLASVLGKPLWLPAIPAWTLRILIGEAATALTNGVFVSSDKIIDDGFQFLYPELKPALKHLLGR